jgi:hypothetical protein
LVLAQIDNMMAENGLVASRDAWDVSLDGAPGRFGVDRLFCRTCSLSELLFPCQ